MAPRKVGPEKAPTWDDRNYSAALSRLTLNHSPQVGSDSRWRKELEKNAEGGEHIRTAGARCWRGPAPTGVAERKAVKDADIVDVRAAGGGQASSDAAAG